MKDFLTVHEISILKEGHRASQFRKSADRIKTVLLLNEGFSFAQVAKMLLLDDTTIRRYILTYKEKGIDGLLEDHYHGAKAFLSKEDEKELTIQLKNNIYQTIKAVSLYVERTFGVSYSIEGMTHLLHRLGFLYKKTKVIPGKVDLKKQEQFKKEYEELKQDKKTDDKIYFLDAAHPHHNNRPFYGWIYKGEEKAIKTNTGRKRVNLNGALSLDDMDITVLTLRKPSIAIQ